MLRLGSNTLIGTIVCFFLATPSYVYGQTQDLTGLAKAEDGGVPAGPDDNKKRAKAGDFDEKAEIACAQIKGEVLGKCKLSVARSGGGDATAVIRFQNSFSRTLYFTDGDFIRGNTTMSGTGKDTEWTLINGVYSIRVDDQRFEIPAALILGE